MSPPASTGTDFGGLPFEPPLTGAAARVVPEPDRKYDAFFSYARVPDEDVVLDTRSFLDRLRKLKIPEIEYIPPARVWVDRLNNSVHRARRKQGEQAEPGPDLRRMLRDALAESELLVLFCSPGAVASGWVDAELREWLTPTEGVLAPRGPIWFVVTEGDPEKAPADVFPAAVLPSVTPDTFWYDFRGYRDRKRRKDFHYARIQFAADLFHLDDRRVAVAVELDERRRRRIRRTVAGVAAGIVAAASAGTWYTVAISGSTGTAAKAQMEIASDPVKAVGLALAALETSPWPRPAEAIGVLREAMQASRLRARLAVADPAIPVVFGHRVDDRGRSQLATSDGLAVRVFESPGWSLLGGPLDHTGAYRLAFSGDDHRLATVSGEEIRIWEWTGTDWRAIPRPFRRRGLLTSVAMSEDGTRLLAGAHDGKAAIWNVGDRTARRKVKNGRASPIFTVSFTPDERSFLTAGEDGVVRLWSSDDRYAAPVLLSHGPGVAQVADAAFSRSGRFLAVALSDDRVVLWDLLHDGRPEIVATLPHPGRVCSVAFSPDEGLVATMTRPGALAVWNVARTEQPILELPPQGGAEGEHCGVAFSPDGHLVAAAGQDQFVRLWDADPLVEPEILRLSREATALSLSAKEGTRNVVAGDAWGTSFLWLGESGTRIRLGQHANAIETAAFSPDQRKLATASEVVKIFSVPAGTEIGTFPRDGADQMVVERMRFTPQGELAVLGRERLEIWTADGDPHRVLREPAPTLNEDPDGLARDLAVVAGSGEVVAVFGSTLFRIPSPSSSKPQRYELAGPPVRRARFSLDGAFLLTGDASFVLRSSREGRAVGEEIRPDGPVDDVVLSPHGERVATLSGADVSFWDARTGTRLAEISSGADVAVTAFHPSARLFAIGGFDGSVSIWDVDDGERVSSLPGQDRSPIQRLAFTSDGGHLVTASRKGRVRMYPREAFLPLETLLESTDFELERRPFELPIVAAVPKP